MKDRYSLWDEIRRMQQQMDAMFENLFASGRIPESSYLLPVSGSRDSLVSSYRQPLSDMYETDKEFVIELEIPGVDKKGITISVDEKGIEVKAEMKSETKQEDKKKGIYRVERNYAGFYRYFELPSNANPEKASAEYKDGILKIVIPKTKDEESKRKLIEVK